MCRNNWPNLHSISGDIFGQNLHMCRNNWPNLHRISGDIFGQIYIVYLEI